MLTRRFFSPQKLFSALLHARLLEFYIENYIYWPFNESLTILNAYTRIQTIHVYWQTRSENFDNIIRKFNAFFTSTDESILSPLFFLNQCSGNWFFKRFFSFKTSLLKLMKFFLFKMYAIYIVLNKGLLSVWKENCYKKSKMNNAMRYRLYHTSTT